MGFGLFRKKQENSAQDGNHDVLKLQNILLGQKSVTKEAAIERAGQLLAEGGYVTPDYVNAMKEREKIVTTYIGNGIAIPHGIGEVKDQILKSGISIVQYPQGVVFGEGNTAYLVVGIAGKGNEHLQILAALAEYIQDEETAKELFEMESAEQMYAAFTSQL